MAKSEQGVDTSQDRYTTIPRVLVFIFNEGQVLLLKGAPTKRIWANRYNGVGGHVEANEDVYKAAKREAYEETGLDIHNLRLRGVINIDIGTLQGIMMFVFTACSVTRATTPSEEGTLAWFSPADLPPNPVKDVPVLLERITAMSDSSAPFFGRYAYDDQEQISMTFAQAD